MGRGTMVAKHRERSIVRRLFSASLESKLSHSYEHLTELLADASVEFDIFRPWVENATRTPWSRWGSSDCRVVHGCELDELDYESVSKVGAA